MTLAKHWYVESHLSEKGDELFSYQWNQLGEGERVIVQREDQSPLSGEVDIVADDGSIFWIWLNNGKGRIAIYPDEESRVWLPKAQPSQGISLAK